MFERNEKKEGNYYFYKTQMSYFSNYLGTDGEYYKYP